MRICMCMHVYIYIHTYTQIYTHIYYVLIYIIFFNVLFYSFNDTLEKCNRVFLKKYEVYFSLLLRLVYIYGLLISRLLFSNCSLVHCV